jgi:predicted AlkP superfamily phosphohydrolase/phosphomutase
VRNVRLTQKLALLVALLATGVFACGDQPSQAGRVLIIGIDGASLPVVESLIAEGRLPNLAAIAETGASGKLRSLKPLLSPRVWTSVATGRTPSEHGIRGWIEIPKGDREGMRIFDSHDRQVHALWNIFSRRDRSVAIVNWLMTYPPEPVNGVMITDSLYPEEVVAKRKLSSLYAKSAGGSLREATESSEPTTWPAEWAERATEEDHQTPLVPLAVPFASLEGEFMGPFKPLATMAPRDSGIASVALEIEAELEPDLMMILLQGIDRASHFSFGALQDEAEWPESARTRAAGHRQLGEGLVDFYAYTDALIGRLLEGYAADDLVLVLSDHGFHASENFPLGEHVADEALDGVLFARGRGIAPGTRAEGISVLDIAPTVLAWAGLPVAEDMAGEVAGFLRLEPAPAIASYEDEPIPRLTRTPSGREAERLEELRALGYVE